MYGLVSGWLFIFALYILRSLIDHTPWHRILHQDFECGRWRSCLRKISRLKYNRGVSSVFDPGSCVLALIVITSGHAEEEDTDWTDNET